MGTSLAQIRGDRVALSDKSEAKARRIVDAREVLPVKGRGYWVKGDTDWHWIYRSSSDRLTCDCVAGSFGNDCSHILAVQMWVEGEDVRRRERLYDAAEDLLLAAKSALLWAPSDSVTHDELRAAIDKAEGRS
jgi:hypothetical protein